MACYQRLSQISTPILQKKNPTKMYACQYFAASKINETVPMKSGGSSEQCGFVLVFSRKEVTE